MNYSLNIYSISTIIVIMIVFFDIKRATKLQPILVYSFLFCFFALCRRKYQDKQGIKSEGRLRSIFKLTLAKPLNAYATAQITEYIFGLLY